MLVNLYDISVAGINLMSDKPIPNLFIIGAMKSGTTSLHEYLNEHPDIFMSEVKEPGYFAEELNLDKGEDWYLSLFKGAGDAQIIGESSTHYSKYPAHKNVAERIAGFSPDARLVYVMRDPIERALSQYWFSIDSSARRPVGNIYMERRPILTAFKEDNSFTDFSDYALQLRQYLDYFPLDKIYTLTFESLISEPALETNKLLLWLGVTGCIENDIFEKRWNSTSEKIVSIKGFGLLQKLRCSGAWDMISPLVPRSLRKVGTSLAVGDTEKDQAKEEQAINYLRPILQERTKKLTELLGKEFPEWVTLYSD